MAHKIAFLSYAFHVEEYMYGKWKGEFAKRSQTWYPIARKVVRSSQRDGSGSETLHSQTFYHMEQGGISWNSRLILFILVFRQGRAGFFIESVDEIDGWRMVRLCPFYVTSFLYLFTTEFEYSSYASLFYASDHAHYSQICRSACSCRYRVI